jgi:hypothetical protein
VTVDQVEAIKWLRKAAGQRYTTANASLSGSYSHNDNVKEDRSLLYDDEREEVMWLSKAAEQGVAGYRLLKKPSDTDLGLIRIPGNNQEVRGQVFLEGKAVVFDPDGNWVIGRGSLHMYADGGYWHPMIVVKHSDGRLMQVKVGMKLIRWVDDGTVVEIKNLAETLECDNGEKLKIISALPFPDVDKGVLFLKNELGNLSLVIKFWSNGTAVGDADFLFITDKNKLNELREKTKADH